MKLSKLGLLGIALGVVFMLSLTPGFSKDSETIQQAQALTVNAEAYVPLESVLPGQLRVDQKNIAKKVTAQKAYLKEHPDFFKENNSTLTINQAIPVVKVKEGGNVVYRVADSHHEVLAAIQLGSTKLPIKIIADFTDQGDAPFDALEKAGYVDLYDRSGTRVDKISMTWQELKNQQDDLRAYITAHVKKIVWGTGEDKTASLQNEKVLLVKADKNPTTGLPVEEITKNTHLENRLSTVIRKEAPRFAMRISLSKVKPDINTLKVALKLIPWSNFPQWADQLQRARFVFETDPESAKQKVDAYIQEIKGK